VFGRCFKPTIFSQELQTRAWLIRRGDLRRRNMKADEVGPGSAQLRLKGSHAAGPSMPPQLQSLSTGSILTPAHPVGGLAAEHKS
jgi:hypothetical protein